MFRPALAIHRPWVDLLTKRTLLYEHLRSFRNADDFPAKVTSPRLADRRDAAALERFAEAVLNVYVDLGRELLTSTAPVDSFVLQRPRWDSDQGDQGEREGQRQAVTVG
jgi:hypothetical protein